MKKQLLLIVVAALGALSCCEQALLSYSYLTNTLDGPVTDVIIVGAGRSPASSNNLRKAVIPAKGLYDHVARWARSDLDGLDVGMFVYTYQGKRYTDHTYAMRCGQPIKKDWEWEIVKTKDGAKVETAAHMKC